MVKIAEIKSLIAVNNDDYTACIDSIEHSDTISSLRAKLHCCKEPTYAYNVQRCCASN
ncbi:hypothetical protein D3C75_894100 [compost metagenome]